MAKYNHGVGVNELATQVGEPQLTLSGIPVVVGTAPVHLAKKLNSSDKGCCFFRVRKLRRYLCREKCPVHFAQLSMHVWKYSSQMSRNKNILNL